MGTRTLEAVRKKRKTIAMDEDEQNANANASQKESPKKANRWWTTEEISALLKGIKTHGNDNGKIADDMGTHTLEAVRKKRKTMDEDKQKQKQTVFYQPIVGAASYQPKILLDSRRGLVQNVTQSRGGVEIATPNHVRTQEEFDNFNLQLSATAAKGGSMKNDGVEMTPPLFCFMQQKGEICKVPYEAEFLAQYEDKKRDKCKCFAQNPNFVSIPEDKLDPGYHKIDDQGDGYRVINGNIYFPRVYYVTTGGFVILCARTYVSPKFAKQHLLAGTADILGCRRIGGTRKKYSYLIRTYTIASTKPDCHYEKRYFYGSDCKMEGRHATIDLASLVLTTFVGPCPKGHIAQHDDESWNNAIEFLRWIPCCENYWKENLDPQ